MPKSKKKVRHVNSPGPKRSRGASTKVVPAASGVDPLHRPIMPEEVAARTPLRTRIDRVLPPFSAQRYLAIWLLGTIPLIGLILLLLRPWDPTPRSPGGATGATATARADGTRTRTPLGPTATAVAISILSTTAVVSSQPPGSPQEGAPADMFLVIETEKGRIVARLHTEPSLGVERTLEGFAEKARSGYFDGLQFHRVESWMIQGGDPHDTSRVVAEYNSVPFVPGSLALPHGVDPEHNSNTQFIIVKAETPALDGQYTNLGQVVEGMDVVNSLVTGDKMTRVTVNSGQ